MKPVSPQVDSLLLPFLLASDEREEEIVLARLISEHVEPIVEKTIRYKLQFYFTGIPGDVDIEEVFYETRLNLLKRLRALKKGSANIPVSNLNSYVTTATRHACDEYLRRKHPKRRHLKDKIRYHLSTHAGLALWETKLGWMAGLASWDKRDSPNASAPAGRTSELAAFLETKLHDRDLQQESVESLLFAIFHAVNEPIEIDCLTGIVAKLWGIEDRPNESIEREDVGELGWPAATQATPDELTEYHQQLEKVWTEINQLPRRQRVALLLNLRSPQRINVITLFPATNIATFEQIAEALEIPAGDFEQVWSRLPLDDTSIGELIGATRQQVINLRRNARDRLMRRMHATGRETRQV